MGSEDATLTLREAVALHRSGNLADAEAAYRALLEAEPDHGDALHFLGVLLHHGGRSEEGLALIRQASSLLPGHAVVHNNLGNVLQAMGTLPEAIAAYRAAIEADSAYAVAHFNLGVVLEREGNLSAAIDSFRRSATLKPRDVDSLGRLALVLQRAGRRSEAGAAARVWLDESPDDPVAAHLLAACAGGLSLDRASAAYVTRIFDSAAKGFDEHIGALGYRAPDLLGATLAAELGDGAGDLLVLDAGCGTGLAAPHLRPYARRLDGVDLSPGMIEMARARGLYDRLEVAELVAHLQRTPDTWDLIACLDTLIYFGRLDPVLTAAAGSLRVGGRFVFTLESLDGSPEEEFELGFTGRFRHGEAYVRRAVAAAGLEIRSLEQAVQRTEDQAPVNGFVVCSSR